MDLLPIYDFELSWIGQLENIGHRVMQIFHMFDTVHNTSKKITLMNIAVISWEKS